MGQSFVKGAAILGAAAFISKLLGVFYRIPYQNMTGDEGLYIYQQVYPLYSTLLVLATAGFPIAVSKLVSERLALGDTYGAKRVFRLSSTVLTATGVFFFCILFFGAEIIAEWMGNPDMLTLPIKSVSFALLIVPTMSVMRGYFQGHQNMVPTAVSQVTEQFVRVFTIIVAAYWVMSRGMDLVYAGAGAVFGAVTGALAAFVTLLFYWRRNQNMQRELAATATVDRAAYERESNATVVKRILYYAIPICFGSLVLPLLGLVDSFTVANLLERIQGLNSLEAAALKGVYDRGQPLIQFSAFFATALSLAIVPAVSEALAKGQHALVALRAEIALRITFLFGLPASVGLAVIAEPTNILLYENGRGSFALAVLAFTTVFSTLGVTSSGILQGLGLVLLPARNLFVGVLVKLLFNLVLIGPLGIVGAAIATVAAYTVSTALNLWAIVRRIKPNIYWREFLLKPMLAALLMAASVFAVMAGVRFALEGALGSLRLAMLVTVITSVATGVVVYTLILFRSGAISREDLQSVPRLNRKLSPWLEKFRLLK
ncbi:MAG: polysaccharide biosynthesis protein [Novibacillus thermophilus]